MQYVGTLTLAETYSLWGICLHKKENSISFIQILAIDNTWEYWLIVIAIKKTTTTVKYFCPPPPLSCLLQVGNTNKLCNFSSENLVCSVCGPHIKVIRG